MALVRLSSEGAARALLQRLVDSGRCTVEDFDTPPPGHINPSAYKNLLRTLEPPAEVSISDPRDFTPAPGHTPALDPPAPLSQPSDDHRPTSPPEPEPGVYYLTNAEPDEEEPLPF